MKKAIRIFLAVAVVFCAVISPLSASAAGNVRYDGRAGSFVFEPGSRYSPTDLFDSFKALMPGDSRTQQITVKNNAAEKTDIKVYMRSHGAVENSEDLLSLLTLSVKAEDDTKLFEAPADEKATLEDWVYLGLLHYGAEVKLTLRLDVPITLGNEYQDKVGYLDWEFKVEEYEETEPTTEEPTTQEPTTEEPTTQEPTTEEPATKEQTTAQPTTEEPTSAQKETTTQRAENPDTNDVNDVYIYSSLGAVCLIAFAVVIFLAVKRHKRAE